MQIHQNDAPGTAFFYVAFLLLFIFILFFNTGKNAKFFIFKNEKGRSWNQEIYSSSGELGLLDISTFKNIFFLVALIPYCRSL